MIDVSSQIKTSRNPNTFLEISFVLCLSGFICLVSLIPNHGYQVSIYEAVGWRFVFLIFAVILLICFNRPVKIRDHIYMLTLGWVCCSIPLLLGNFLYGRADVPHHFWFAQNILQEGSLPVNLFYPTFHLILVFLTKITHFNLGIVYIFIPGIQFIIFYISIYYLLSVFMKGSHHLTQSALVLLASISFSVLSTANSFANILLLLCLALIIPHSSQDFQRRISLVFCIFALIYAHPITVIVLTSFIFSLGMARALQKHRSWLYLALFPLVVFTQWFSTFGVFKQQIRILRDFITLEATGTPVTKLIENVGKANVTLGELSYIILRTYGHMMLSLSLILIIVIYLTKFEKYRFSDHLSYWITFSTLIIMAGFAIILPIGGSLRYLYYVVIFANLGIIIMWHKKAYFELTSYLHWITVFCTICLWIFSFFSLYNDPYRRDVNQSIPFSEYRQYSFLDKSLNNEQIVGTINSTRLDRIMTWLPNLSEQKFSDYRWNKRTSLPDHFLLDCRDNVPSVCPDIINLPFPDIVTYPEVFQTNRYTYEDFFRVLTENNLVYSGHDGFILKNKQRQ